METLVILAALWAGTFLFYAALVAAGVVERPCDCAFCARERSARRDVTRPY